ncbi:MAG: DUF3592 domain-containing protein [Myxococcota bacterium]
MTPPRPPEEPQSRSKLLMAFVGVVLGGALFYIGGQGVANEARLRAGSATLKAQVTDTRIRRGIPSGTSYDVQYRFKLKGSKTLYTHRDEIGRTNLWASLPKETWNNAQASGNVKVAYLPENPWINRPTQSGAMPLGDPITGACLGLTIGASCLGLLLGMIRRAIRSRKKRNKGEDTLV